MNDDEVIAISPKANQNSLQYAIAGSVLLLISLLLVNFWWSELKLQLTLLLLISGLVIFLGILKSYQPKYSYLLTRQGIIHIHKVGKWSIDWQQIERVGRPTFTSGIEQSELPYIAIKLKDLAYIAEHISPRLANKLLHEQRDLLMFAIRAGDIPVEEMHLNCNPFKINKKIYKGPIAAWLHRTETLVKVFGYDVYISSNSLDREPEEFIELLKSCHKFKLNVKK